MNQKRLYEKFKNSNHHTPPQLTLSYGQETSTTQNLKGTIVDSESKFELIGASVMAQVGTQTFGTTTDLNGTFKLENIPVGRINIQVSYIGYQTEVIHNLLLSSGKEIDLNIGLKESLNVIEGIEITASGVGNEALNEMAVVSGRSFSVEETQRYAGGFGDPARMVAAFSGVANSGDDLSNEISIRGNSPKGVLWQLEGIEVPNPNHFGSLGASGGGISMLSGSVMARSDFYIGAFPAEYGNALSGVFDIKLRNGNPDKREHSFSFGLLGIEAATEGPFAKNSKASYLIQYRYSTFALLGKVYNPIGDILPAYQDAVVKVNVPTDKAGKFTFFALGGHNNLDRSAEPDSTAWEYDWENVSFSETQTVGMAGISHFYPIGNDAYIKTIGLASVDNYTDEYTRLLADENYQEELFDFTTFKENNYRIKTTYNKKINAKNTWRIGGMFNVNTYNFDYNFLPDDSDIFVTPIKGKGDGSRIHGFVQWKHRPTENLTLLLGGHSTYFGLNDTYTFEPRLAFKYTLSNTKQLSFAAGLHSKPEHTSTYLAKSSDNTSQELFPNLNMDIQQSLHLIGGYKQTHNNGLTFNAEAYYQYLFNVPVAADDRFTTLNASSIWDILEEDVFISEGTGANYGLDLSVQKDFSRGLYYLFTGSLFNSTYTTATGETFNTRFNSNYTCNALGGKEFYLKKNDNIIGVNGKIIFNGGTRRTPIDLASSVQQGDRVNSAAFMEGRTGPYYRLDIGVSYKVNKKNATHSFIIDVQNVTNRLNEGGRFYNTETEEIEIWTQTGLFPNMSYKVEF